MQEPHLGMRGGFLVHLINRDTFNGLAFNNIGTVLPYICQLLFATNSHITDKDTISGFQLGKADLSIIVLFVSSRISPGFSSCSIISECKTFFQSSCIVLRGSTLWPRNLQSKESVDGEPGMSAKHKVERNIPCAVMYSSIVCMAESGDM